MKLIGSLSGLAAVQVSGEAVMPAKGVVVKDLIDGIGRQYEFAVKPPPQMLMQGQQPTVFQGGVFKAGEQRIGIAQLGMVQNGDFVIAQTTDYADAVLSDLIRFLSETFGYRYASAEQRRHYHSNVIVQFEKDMDAFDLFAKIASLLNQGREANPPRFQFKRIGFGQGDWIPGNLSIDTIEAADFTIERRAGEPYSSNRFFCAGPMKTEELLGLLEKIEKLF